MKNLVWSVFLCMVFFTSSSAIAQIWPGIPEGMVLENSKDVTILVKKVQFRLAKITKSQTLSKRILPKKKLKLKFPFKVNKGFKVKVTIEYMIKHKKRKRTFSLQLSNKVAQLSI